MKILPFALFTLLLFNQCKRSANLIDVSAPVIDLPKSSDQLAIEKVITNYFDGWLTGDTTLIGSAMHSTCHLKYVKEGKLEARNRTEYLSNFKPRPRLKDAEGRIISIGITITAAEAKVELETGSRLFTDYFNLLKEGERWYITDKVSTNITKVVKEK